MAAMVKKVGVVGCNTMGAGITQVVLEAGYSVRVREIGPALLEKGLMAVKRGLERSVEKGILPNSKKESAIGRLLGTLLLEDLKVFTIGMIQKIRSPKISSKRRTVGINRSFVRGAGRDSVCLSNTFILAVEKDRR